MKSKLILIAALLFSNLLSSQALQLMGDLHPGPNHSIPSGSFPNTTYAPGIYLEDFLIFAGFDTLHGLELFKYEEGSIELIKDIRAGKGNSNPLHYQKLNDQILFIAYDTTHGYEWWKTDGTEAGTQLVKDIFPGKESGVTIDESAAFKVIGDYLYFAGEDEKDNAELWRTDGTEEGTVMVKNIGVDFNSFNSRSYPTEFYEFDGQLIFNTIKDGFWISDGTEEGTIQLSERTFFNFADFETFFIFQDNGLWRSDGTPENTFKYADVGYSSFYNASGNRFAKVNDVVVFPASDEEHGDELWRTDGTSAGTYLVKDLIAGKDGYPPQNLHVLNNKAYFRGKSDAAGTELFRSDGTEEGTELAVNFAGGSSSGLAAFSKIFPGNGYLVVYRGNTPSLYITMGSSDSTKSVDLPGNLSNPPKNFYAFEDQLLFYAFSENTGYEPYILNITRLFTPADNDMDGFPEDTDCDDTNASINPGQAEIPYNGIDDDCDARTLDDDLDEDGFTNENDCDDTNAAINPNAEDIPDNEIDENCDGEDAMTSGVNNIITSSVVYPNPVSELLQVSKNTGVLIFDMNGLILEKHSLSVSQIDVSDYQPGIYLISISKGEKRELARFIKI